MSRVECIHSIVNIYHNNKQSFLRTTEVKQCVLIPTVVKITKIALYHIFLPCMPSFPHCITLKWHSSRPIRNAKKIKKECCGKEKCLPNSDNKINPLYHSSCNVYRQKMLQFELQIQVSLKWNGLLFQRNLSLKQTISPTYKHGKSSVFPSFCCFPERRNLYCCSWAVARNVIHLPL